MPGELRVRFGEVEARGIALTPAGRDVVDALPPDAAAWAAALPPTEAGLADAGLAWFGASVAPAADDLRRGGRATAGRRPARWSTPAGCGWTRWSTRTSCRARRPASSGPTSPTTAPGDAGEAGVQRDAAWLAGALGREVHDPMDLYAGQVERSWAAARSALGVAS